MIPNRIIMWSWDSSQWGGVGFTKRFADSQMEQLIVWSHYNPQIINKVDTYVCDRNGKIERVVGPIKFPYSRTITNVEIFCSLSKSFGGHCFRLVFSSPFPIFLSFSIYLLCGILLYYRNIFVCAFIYTYLYIGMYVGIQFVSEVLMRWRGIA